MMGMEVAKTKPEIIVIPFPAQGHINPALAFSKSLASKGLAVSLITTAVIAKSAKFSDCASVAIHSVSDGYEHVEEGTETVREYLDRFTGLYRRNLAEFIDENKSGARAIVYDSIMPWMLDVAKERGMVGASFFTQPCGVSAVFYHLGQGAVRYPYEEVTAAVELPALPPLEKRDLPSFAHVEDPEQLSMKLLTDQFSNLERADWIFFNTFDKLETRIIQWMRERWPISTVGPTFLLDHKSSGAGSKNHTISFFDPKQNDTVREWLDSKETASVVYVSFGSIASLAKDQMAELARGLAASGCHFLWVVRSSELDKLPQDLITSKGLIVEWCHQLEVLAHPALACFVTHCGWNSTLEALSSGVPLVAVAQWVDQNTNARFVEDVWGAGVGVERGEGGIIAAEEIAMRIKQVVEGDEGVEIRRNAHRWKEMASEAVGTGGSSAIHVEDFVGKLLLGGSRDIIPNSVIHRVLYELKY